MEYQKIINLLVNTPNQPTKFRTKNWVEINDDPRGTYNPQIDNAKDIDIVMPMYNLIEYSNNYSKASASLWQYDRDEPNDNITNFELFRSKI